MKRIHYGSHTLDVSNEVAEAVKDVVHELTTRTLFRSKNIGPGMFGSEAFAVGRPSFEQISGYLDGSTEESTVDVLLGGSVPMIIATYYGALADPSGSAESLRRLREWLPAEEDDDEKD